MNFSEILADVYSDLNFQSTPTAPVIARIKRSINEAVRTVIGEPGMTRLLDSDVPNTFNSVADQARYALPDSVAKIHGIRDTSNDRTLDAMSMSEYRRIDPDPTSNSGTPTHYVPMGLLAVATPPPFATTFLSAVSTDVTETPTIYVEGIVSGGYVRSASKAMTGNVAVTVDAAAWIDVTDCYLSANAVGTITLIAQPSATTLAQINIGTKRPRYYGVYLWPTPSSPTVYMVDCRREMVELVNDTDTPPLPTDFHYLLSAYARMRYYEKAEDPRYQIAQAQYEKGLSRLKYATQTGPDELPVIGRAGRIGRSRLGAWTPADSYSRGW